MVLGLSLSSFALLGDGNQHFPRQRRRPPSAFFLPSFLRASVVMCAWFCSGRSNTELVQRLRAANVITSERVKEVRVAEERRGREGMEGMRESK